jgi:hypothetical protein
MVRNNELSIIELSRVFGSRAKAQEIILLLENVKPVVRQGFYADELPVIVKFCNEHNIRIVRSRFIIKIDDADKGFSNKGIASDDTNDMLNGMFFVYLSKDKLLSSKAAILEERHNDELLGRILGYPECCIQYFIENFSEENTDIEIHSKNPYTNLSQRDNDYIILSHFPCSPECKESIELAKKYLETINRHDPEYVRELLVKLSSLNKDSN